LLFEIFGKVSWHMAFQEKVDLFVCQFSQSYPFFLHLITIVLALKEVWIPVVPVVFLGAFGVEILLFHTHTFNYVLR
jgi:hypothetical protein